MHHWGRLHGLYACLYALFIVLGRLTRVPENDLALWWPASGIAVLWGLHAARGRPLVVCATGVLLLAGLGNAVTGLSLAASPWFGLANAGIAVGAAGASAALRRRGRPFSADRPVLRVPRDLANLLLAAGAGVALSVPPMMVGLAVSAELDLSTDFVVEWLARNLTGAFAVAALWLTWVDRRTHDAILRATDGGPRAVRRGEAALLVVLTAAAVVQVFAVDHDLPLVFLLIALSVWAGARFPPFWAAAQAVGAVVGAAALLGAGAGGPLVDEEPFRAALVVQAMGLVALAVALFLSLAVQEKDLVSASLEVAERDARTRADLLATMTEAMADGLVVVDADGVPLVANEAAAALGADAWTRAAFDGSAGGRGPFRRLDGSELDREEHPARRALRGETTSSLDLLHVHPETGEKTVVSVSAAPVGPEPGSDEQVAVLLLRDVTLRHRQLSQLQAFAGVVAHDLQNPLFASKGWAEVVAEGLDGSGDAVAPPVREALRRTISSLGRAQLLVNDLLGFTRASTDTVDVRTLDLDALVEAEMAELRARFDCPAAELEKGVLGEVRMDPTLARQVFANLLGNAIKYAPPGVVPRIGIAVARDGAGVRIEVSDNGPGIPPEHRQLVFEPFHRVRPEVPGTGLGLAICAEAVERHGGSISVGEGPGGGGCTFSLHLPRGGGEA